MLLLAILSIAVSCNNDRDGNSNFQLENETPQLSSKVSPADPLCRIPEPATSFYGNPNDYPKLYTPTLYSLTEPSDSNTLWFFNEAFPSIKGYLLSKYNGGRNMNFRWSTTESYFQDLTYDYDYSFTISNSEQGVNWELTPNQMMSAAAGSYVQYRILSTIDEHVEWRKLNFGVDVKPLGITYSYSTTMCGSYVGLLVRVFFKVNP